MSIAANETQALERRIGTDEELITLTEATKHLPKVDGKKVAVCTLWRWCRRGLSRIRQATPLRFGKAHHKGLELFHAGAPAFGQDPASPDGLRRAGTQTILGAVLPAPDKPYPECISQPHCRRPSSLATAGESARSGSSVRTRPAGR